MDFPRYIESAREHVKRSNHLWKDINFFILHSLEQGEQMGMTLEDVANLLEQAAGEKKQGEPVCLSNLRGAARQIRAREELVLI